jgi:hypothetical protein
MSIVRALSESAPQRLASPEQTQPHEGEDRRQCERHRCQVDAYCQPIAGQTGRWPAKAVDISTASVSLVISRRFEPGTLLAIGLQNSSDGDCMPLARVQRVAPDGVYWRLACVWADPISADELKALIGVAA